MLSSHRPTEHLSLIPFDDLDFQSWPKYYKYLVTVRRLEVIAVTDRHKDASENIKSSEITICPRNGYSWIVGVIREKYFNTLPKMESFQGKAKEYP